MRHYLFALSLIAWFGSGFAAGAAERADVLVADFEGTGWGDWTVTGDAFGPGPARGTLPNQMPVSGFRGQGLVNSYHQGDPATGTLTSPAFALQRRYLNFLIGGGDHPGKTCVELLVEGKVVRTATGRNSEQLDWHSFDLGDLQGKQARVRIVDEHTGRWGHVLVDHLVLSDRRRQSGPARREVVVDRRCLLLPVRTGAPKRRLRLTLDGRTVREFDIELADGEPGFWVFSDVGAWKGRNLVIEVDALPEGSRGLASVTQGDGLKGEETLYREKHRPQFHFTSRRGWLNDPNGLVFAGGAYHLFYQHNPYGWNWGNMHWGHAVSEDLVHWREGDEALYPKRFGDWAFSGSAVVDRDNTAGFRTGDGEVIVAAYTSTGRGECIVFSNDGGKTWTEYAGNPVVRHAGRDPRLLWHAPSRRWVMAVYDEFAGKRWIAFHTSPDLKTWIFRSRIEGFYECPDLFEQPVEGSAGDTKWVLYGADGKYVLGAFDGERFTAEPGRHQLWYGNFYAAQTFSDVPDGRRIQIGWGRGITFPGMPFNQQMTIPCRLTLRQTPDGVRLFAEPVQEVERLYGPRRSWSDVMVKPGAGLVAEAPGELLDIRAELELGDAEAAGLTVRGIPVVYDRKREEVRCQNHAAPLRLRDGRLRLRLLVDRGSVEVFGNDGRVALSAGVLPASEGRTVEAFSRGGAIRLRSLEATALKSGWYGR
jgi:fructan beta-fructosidase